MIGCRLHKQDLIIDLNSSLSFQKFQCFSELKSILIFNSHQAIDCNGYIINNTPIKNSIVLHKIDADQVKNEKNVFATAATQKRRTTE